MGALPTDRVLRFLDEIVAHNRARMLPHPAKDGTGAPPV